MKFRVGFVSNSSSSSFILRGIRISEAELESLWNLKTIDANGKEVVLDSWIKARDFGLDIESTRDYFDGEETGEVVVGVDFGGLEDGCVMELDQPDDEVVKQLLAKSGIIAEKLSTFAQYVSNDNY